MARGNKYAILTRHQLTPKYRASNPAAMNVLRLLHQRTGFSVCLFACALSLTPPASAEEGNNSSSAFTLRGFGTLGLARSSNDQAEFVRDLSQPRGITSKWSGKIDSMLGLQANFKANDTLEAVAQAVSRYHSNGNFSPELTWAFLKYDPNAYLSLRAGRFGTEFYIHADSRLIGYSTLTVRPAPDFFVSLPFFYIDGVDAQLTVPLGEGILRGKVYTGLAREKIPLATEQLDINGARMAGAYVDYLQGAWLWRASYAQIRFNHDLPPPVDLLRNSLTATGVGAAQSAANALSLDGQTGHFYSVGAVYDGGPLQAQVSLSRIRQDSVILENSRSGMLVVGYRVGEVTPFTGYSWVKSDAKHLSTGLPNVGVLTQINSGVASVMADSHSNQHTTTLGLRWDFRRDMALKVQADAIRGTPESIFPYRRETTRWNGNTNVLSTTLDFIF